MMNSNNLTPHVEEPKKKQVTIESSSTGVSFIVRGVEDEEMKKKLREMGGHWNTRVRGYMVPANKLDQVCGMVGLEKDIELTDPRKLITVQFTQSFKWSGEMTVAEQKLKQAGLQKKTGKGNVWTGDLTLVNNFFAQFAVTE